MLFLKESVAYKHKFANKKVKEMSILVVSVSLTLNTLQVSLPTHLLLNVFLFLILYGEKVQAAPGAFPMSSIDCSGDEE